MAEICDYPMKSFNFVPICHYTVANSLLPYLLEKISQPVIVNEICMPCRHHFRYFISLLNNHEKNPIGFLLRGQIGSKLC